MQGRLKRFAGYVVLAAALACGSDGPADPGSATGSVSLTVAGLPAGTSAGITITGPSGFSRSVTASQTISGLTPGSYTITATNVVASDGRYAPLPLTQSLSVAAGSTPTSALVTYALASGSLTIAVAGLPAGVDGAVTITGPNQYSRQVTSTTTLTALDPGTYTITGAEVSTATDRYSAGAAQSATVAVGTTPASAAVTYALATGRLTITITGLPSGSAAAVTVTGPNGYTRSVTATTPLIQLTPGAYTLNTANVVNSGITYGAPPVQTVTVVPSSTAATVTVAYGPVDASLTITVAGLPLGVNAAITVTGPSAFNRTVTGTTTLVGLASGSYVVTAVNVSSGSSTYSPTPPSQVVTLTTGATPGVTVSYAVPIVLALSRVATGFDRPVQLVSVPDDPRLFVVEQTGRIKIIQNGQVLAQPFLDLSARILPLSSPDDEQGLLGLAFDPQFSANNTFYVFYMDLSQDLVIEKYQVSANPNVANTSGTLVLKIPHRVYTDHNGGGMVFGPDAYLYVSVGDGGCCVDPLRAAQDLNSMLGKILRIDVRGTPFTLPPTNPFVGQAGRLGQILHYGLRNPWRIDIDPVTQTLYIADVGEDDREEINVVPLGVAGSNFGWSILEGTRCLLAPCSSQGFRLPVLEYTHGEGCSITGGGVYRGSAIPEVVGHYFYSDYCTGFLRSFLYSGGQPTLQKDWNIESPGFVTSFGRDASGELYMLTLSGSVYKLIKQ